MRHTFASFFLFAAISTAAQAASAPRSFVRETPPEPPGPIVSPLPQAELTEGTYVAEKTTGLYFINGRFLLTRWADEFVLTAQVSYGGVPWDYEVQLRFVRPGVYAGDGQISGRFTNGQVCRYTTSMELHLAEGKVYLRDFSPGTLYNQLSPSGLCYEAGAYSWFTHRSAYVKLP